MSEREEGLPSAFIWRRFHSFLGLALVLFLFEHLLTNSEAALLIGEDGAGFIRMVNFIHALPYLQVLELSLVFMPLAIHAAWGVRYLMTGKPNSFRSDGSAPSIRDNPRNFSYTWQRTTSWILLIGIVFHVGQMRFLRYPEEVKLESGLVHMVKVSIDEGLYTVAHRLGVKLYDAAMIEQMESRSRVLQMDLPAAPPVDETSDGGSDQLLDQLNPRRAQLLVERQRIEQKREWLETLQEFSPAKGEAVAEAQSVGTAILLTVRDVMKRPEMMALYSIFVLSAVFHACNGLWTFMITWGITLTPRSQRGMLLITKGLMILLSTLGFASVFATYWINLYH
jgi:succinate dehydrogenase / fumarate reductase cytochrome b subunit